jgi:hypothetical protein
MTKWWHLSHLSHPWTSQLTVNVWGGGGRIGVRGMGCPTPTPQAGRVTVSHGGGRVKVGGMRAGGWGEGGTMPPCYMDLERLNFYIDCEAFKQWH